MTPPSRSLTRWRACVDHSAIHVYPLQFDTRARRNAKLAVVHSLESRAGVHQRSIHRFCPCLCSTLLSIWHEDSADCQQLLSATGTCGTTAPAACSATSTIRLVCQRLHSRKQSNSVGYQQNDPTALDTNHKGGDNFARTSALRRRCAIHQATSMSCTSSHAYMSLPPRLGSRCATDCMLHRIWSPNACHLSRSVRKIITYGIPKPWSYCQPHRRMSFLLE